MRKLSWLVAAIAAACVYCSYGQGLNPVVPSSSVDLTGTNDGGGTGVISNMSGVYVGSVPVLLSKSLGALTAAVTNNLAIVGNAVSTASLIPSGTTQILTLSGFAANGYYQLELNPTNAVSTFTPIGITAAAWLTAVPTALTANKKSVLSIYSGGTSSNNLVVSFKEAP
jgi:hypothetical protein